VATDVSEAKADFGIVICGSGNGISMTVNKHKVRCSMLDERDCVLARQHNDANNKYSCAFHFHSASGRNGRNF
jgi:ribose 5-phosphate isomerase B